MTTRSVRRRTLTPSAVWARASVVRDSADAASILAEQLQEDCWADLPAQSVRRALDTADSDLRGKVHLEELAPMVARLALFRLTRQRTALHDVIR